MRFESFGKRFYPEPDKTASGGPRHHTSAMNKEIGGMVRLILGGRNEGLTSLPEFYPDQDTHKLCGGGQRHGVFASR